MKRKLINYSSIPIVIACTAIALILLFTAQKPVTQNNIKDSFAQSGKASFYANMLHGANTSSGDVYDKNDFTCAHKTLPFNTILSVTNKANGKSAIVKVNDRGPYRKGRIIDLSRSAAQKIGMVPNGIANVKILELNFLDLFPIHDSLFHAGEFRDSHGKLRESEGNLIRIWATDDLKHAIYMATSMEIEYKLDPVYIKAAGSGIKRNYILYMVDSGKKEVTEKLISTLKQNGFSLCRRE